MQAILAALLQLASIELFKRTFLGVLRTLYKYLHKRASGTPELWDDEVVRLLKELIDYCKRVWKL